MKAIMCSLALLLLAGCAPALSGYEMMPKSQLYDSLGNSKTLSRNIILGDVLVDKGMGGMTAPINREQYKEALASSLRQAGWYATSNHERFILDAHLLKVDQPVIGFNFTVTAKAEYTLTEKKTGKVRYNDVLSLPCTVTMSEAFVADVRLRKATACAVSENITHLLNVLKQRY